ncbi:hypothetical protein GQ55_2G248200 [Panicum hallii var. hallii]|uniref:Leucine-rich repeat-containing N-terminal plant-type domain-containing protein n=1 Tax=Panicum hallii var. hallii TaxID=1504633 RepID=A0A2T7ES28_9POAL|nr:hypothetical protein GQ55_2G248200 [Panicum hallii var. hallii]
MKRGGKGGVEAGAATTVLLVALLLVFAASHAGANAVVAAVRRLRAGDDALLVGEQLSGPPANGCSSDPHNQGNSCHIPGAPPKRAP